MDIINFKKANCRNCFRCLRECPVKAIAFKDGQAGILEDDCLICGHCLTVCPQNAKQMRSDIGRVKALIASGRRVAASVAPAFAAAFSLEGEKAFSAFAPALKALGFYSAGETAEGAAAVSAEYERLLAARKTPLLISSACPTIVRLIEKYYPETLPCLAGVVSPMTAHARMLRKTHGDISVVFIGPCISKKDEAGWEKDAVDYVLTFDELQNWFAEEGISFGDGSATVAAVENAPSARLFPVSGGILQSLSGREPDIDYVSVSGIARCRDVLEEVRRGSLHGCFIEMSACEDSCISGPCMIRPRGGIVGGVRKITAFAQARQSSALSSAEIDLDRQFSPRPVVSRQPGEKAIAEVLLHTGKKTAEDELNCGACGYSTCREKALAVCQGKAELDMCMPYMRQRAEFISDNVIAFTPNAIIVLDSFLNIQALNRAAVTMFGTEDLQHFKGRYIGELTDPSLFEEAIVRKQNILDQKTYLYKNDRYVEQSVIYVREHSLVFGIFKDLTDTRKQSEQLRQVKLDTVETADRVIEKQMRIAQEIAMLLGESTAETKIALTKLKETLAERED